MEVDSEPPVIAQEPLESEEDIFNTGIEVPANTLQEAKSSIKELLNVQAAQLKAMLAVKRHVQQNPLDEARFEVRLRKMKMILDARSQKIKHTQTIIRACDAVQAEARNANDSHSGNNGETDGVTEQYWIRPKQQGN
ncbi:hypothetical protein BGZ67_000689, partial [Mortierella alpina]